MKDLVMRYFLHGERTVAKEIQVKTRGDNIAANMLASKLSVESSWGGNQREDWS